MFKRIDGVATFYLANPKDSEDVVKGSIELAEKLHNKDLLLRREAFDRAFRQAQEKRKKAIARLAILSIFNRSKMEDEINSIYEIDEELKMSDQPPRWVIMNPGEYVRLFGHPSENQSKD